MGSQAEDEPYPAQVEVWYTHPSGTTAGFVGYGTLVAPRVVALHVPGPDNEVPAERSARRTTPDPPRVRCRVHGRRISIVGGLLVPPSAEYPDAASAVYLDREHPLPAPNRGQDEPDFPWPGLRGGNTNEEVGAYLRGRAQQDPPDAPRTPPSRGRDEGEPEPTPDPGITPPWCWIWPSCPGCR